MSLLQIVVLALVQGLTEFLPVSSSAHLILVSHVFAWPDQGLVLDVGVHLGTLFAVLIYFRSEIARMLLAWLRPAATAEQRHDRQVGLYIALASLPVLVAGALVFDLVAHWLRDTRVIAVATILFGLALWAGDRFFPHRRRLEALGFRDALWVGLAQAIALIPGVSRSGVTITMGRMLGFDADAAARFSFLLSIPVIAAAGSLGLWEIVTNRVHVPWQEFATAVGLAALAGWFCIAVFLALLRKVGLLPFVIYRLLLGLVLAWLAF